MMNSPPPLFHLMTVGRSVRKGTRGRAVSDLQRFLTEQGFQIEVDGVFGPRTAAAVREFQRRNGLDADGVVGQRTRAVIAQLRQMGDGEPMSPGSMFRGNGPGRMVPTTAEPRMPGQPQMPQPMRDQLSAGPTMAPQVPAGVDPGRVQTTPWEVGKAAFPQNILPVMPGAPRMIPSGIPFKR